MSLLDAVTSPTALPLEPYAALAGILAIVIFAPYLYWRATRSTG